MKKLITSLSLALFILSSSLYKASPSSEIWSDYTVKCLNFEKNLTEFTGRLEKAIHQNTSPVETEDLRQQFLTLREDYKQIEWLLAYLHTEDANDYFNGAPLPKTERNAPKIIIMDPKGLQRMEEVVFEEEVNLSELYKLSDALLSRTHELNAYQRQVKIYDHQVFEAMRFEIIRIVSLGITGFDTPASGESLKETQVAWDQMVKITRPYIEMAPDSMARRVLAYAEGGSQMLNQADDFDSFDRVAFIRNYADRMYGGLLDVQLALGIELPHEVYESPLAINYASKTLFSNNTFDDRAFLGMTREGNEHAKIALGKRLFYEGRLSKNFDKSCASCHNPDKGFSDGLPTSKGTTGPLKRNSPTLLNAGLAKAFFYDLRAENIDQQAEHVIFNPEEFDSNYKLIFLRLEDDSSYVSEFATTFPEYKGEINRNTLSQALSHYVLSLKTFDSPVDKYLRGESEKLPEDVYAGMNLFMGKASCGTCHFAPTFSGLVPPNFEENESEVLGVMTAPESGVLDPDQGRGGSGKLKDEAYMYEFSFKTVTVRNVAKTGPYFHNGQYKTLREVIDFYDLGGGAGAGLDIPNQTLPPDPLNLSEEEKEQLEAFLLAL
ncbi:MAG: cytochrome c peroxidase [Schleiferiaceae bacterium]